MNRLIVALAAAALGVQPSFASAEPAQDRFAVSYDVGALLSLGRQPNLLDDAMLVGFTASYDITPLFSVLGSLSRTSLHSDGLWEAERSVYMYDAGVQGQYPLATGAGVFVTPFVGAGLGGRSSDFRDVDGRRETDLTSYLAVGGRIEYLFASLGVTARDYLSLAHGSGARRSSTRSDLALFASASVRF